MPWAISVAYFYGRALFAGRGARGERESGSDVRVIFCCVTRGNNWILLGVFIYLFIFASFYASSASAIFLFHLCTPHYPRTRSLHSAIPSLSLSPFPSLPTILNLSTQTAFISYLFARVFFLRAIQVFILLLLFSFFFPPIFHFSLWFYCPIRFVKHFTFVAHMNFKFLKMFQSFRSPLLARCMYICGCVCVCVCVSMWLCALSVVWVCMGRRLVETGVDAKMLIVRKSQCALHATPIDRNDF